MTHNNNNNNTSSKIKTLVLGRIHCCGSPGSPVCPGDPGYRRRWAGSYLGAAHWMVWAGSRWLGRHLATLTYVCWPNIAPVTGPCDRSRACVDEVGHV